MNEERTGKCLQQVEHIRQGFLSVKMKSSLRKFYGCYHDLVDRYGISVNQILKRQKDKQRSTKHTHKTKDRVTGTPLKVGGEPFVRLFGVR
jgi:hypothetical protein